MTYTSKQITDAYEQYQRRGPGDEISGLSHELILQVLDDAIVRMVTAEDQARWMAEHYDLSEDPGGRVPVDKYSGSGAAR